MMHVELAKQLRRGLVPPVGVHGPWQWGTVAAINTANSTISVYLDNNTGVATPGIAYLSSYVPVVGDAVFIGRQSGASRTSRVVMGTIGSPKKVITNQTGSRAIGTVYTSGIYTRLVRITIQLTGNGSSVSWTAAGITSVAATFAGIGGGSVVTTQFTIDVNPNSTYSISSAGTAAIISWVEVDG